MKHLKLFKTQTDFDYKNILLSFPNISLISDANKVIYNFEKVLTIGGGGELISPSVVNAIAL